MTFILKLRILPGSPMLAEYECSSCGLFELLVTRDELGDPPNGAACPDCDEVAHLVMSAPSIKFWSRDPVAINPPGASRHDKPDPRALDTSGLATGKLTRKEWDKMQAGITRERRYQKRLKAGVISKRIQVG
jgi:hypothetical protein